MPITHSKVSAKADGADTSVVRPSDWNAGHAVALVDGDIPATIARDAEVTSAIGALSAVYQPLDSDLTAIAALSTTAYGRAILALADATALRTTAGLVIGTDVPSQVALDGVAGWASRSATFLVAASDATQAEQDAADYVCTGTDDHLTINAALAALPTAVVIGGCVLLSGGNFDIGGSVEQPSGTWLRGMGDSTRLHVADATEEPAVTNVAFATDLALSDFTIDGNRANQATEGPDGITFNGVVRYSIENVRVINPKVGGISMTQGCTDGKVRGCLVSGAGNDGFLISTDCERVTVVNSIAKDGVGDLAGNPSCTGFEVGNNATVVTLVGCIAENMAGTNGNGFGLNNHATPLSSDGPFDVTLIGCVSRDNSQIGFYVFSQEDTGPSRIVLDGCIATDNATDGFRIHESGGLLGGVQLGACRAYSNTSRGYRVIGADDVQFSGCVATDNGSHGFEIEAGAERATLTGCVANSNTSYGFEVAGSDAQLAGCTSRANGISGFRSTGDRNGFSGCRSLSHATGRGFLLDSTADDCVLVGCVARSNRDEGFLVQGNRHQLVGCQAMGSTDATNGWGIQANNGAGHQLISCAATGNALGGLRANTSDIHIKNCRSQNNGTYGIRNAGTGNVLMDNYLSGNTTANLLDTGTSTVIRNNTGFVTENTGTGTIASGATSVVINHGLGLTPTAAMIRVTPTNNPTTDPGHMYVNTVTATQFTVHCRADPGASGLTFSWKVLT